MLVIPEKTTALKFKSSIGVFVPVWNVIVGLILVFGDISDDVFIKGFNSLFKKVIPHVRKNYSAMVQRMILEDKRRPEFHVIVEVVRIGQK